ncbi:MAG: co-chaperone GroES [Clostridia bacterium]|nr:co-chaperone GroES [Clostridia bacterium]
MANIKPILDKVVVKIQKQKTLGGLILAGSQKDQPITATVIARGPGGMINGKEVKMYVNEGDTVLIPKHVGTEVNLNGEEYIIVAQEDILAMVV